MHFTNLYLCISNTTIACMLSWCADSNETFLAKLFKIPGEKRAPLPPLGRSIVTASPPCPTGPEIHEETCTTPLVNIYNDRHSTRGRRRGRKLSCHRQIKHDKKRRSVDLTRKTPPKKMDTRKTPPKKLGSHSTPVRSRVHVTHSHMHIHMLT